MQGFAGKIEQGADQPELLLIPFQHRAGAESCEPAGSCTSCEAEQERLGDIIGLVSRGDGIERLGAGAIEEEGEPRLAGGHFEGNPAAGGWVSRRRAEGGSRLFGELPDELLIARRGFAAQAVVEVKDNGDDAGLPAEGEEEEEEGDGVRPPRNGYPEPMNACKKTMPVNDFHHGGA